MRLPLALVGPTATGKTQAAIELASILGAEIVSVDSMLIYRAMDVGTAKPSMQERARVPHHLIDVAEPSERFSVSSYQALGRRALADIGSRGCRALLTGGSGLYFRALVDELDFPGTDPRTRELLEREAVAVGPERLHVRLQEMDPDAARKIEPRNVRRTIRALEVAAITGREFSSFGSAWDRYPSDRVHAAGVSMPPDLLETRIVGRVSSMLDRGLVHEVEALLSRGLAGWITSTQAIGYAEIAAHLRGRMSLEEAAARTVKRTKKLARRQMAWFRRDPRIRWFEAGPEGAAGLLDELRTHLELA